MIPLIKSKPVTWPSYLYNWNPYTGKTTFLYWNSPDFTNDRVCTVFCWKNDRVITGRLCIIPAYVAMGLLCIVSHMVDIVMTSSNGNIFRVTGLLCGGQWIPLTRASDAELSCFLWSAPEQTVEQTMEMPVIWVAIALIVMILTIALREFPRDLSHYSNYWRAYSIAITHGCVRNDSETHETVLLDCTTGEAGSAIQ